MKLRATLSGLAVAALALGGILVTAGPASASTIVVDTDDDGNTGVTLRAAITMANASAGQDVITFSPSLANQTIELDPLKGTLIITDGVTIEGLGSNQLTLAAASNALPRLVTVQMAEADQDFTLTGITMQGLPGVTGLRVAFPTPFNARNVTVSGVTFNQFSSSGAGMGMIVLNIAGDLTIGAPGEDTAFTSIHGASASALYASNITGDVTITDTLFANNTGVVATPSGALGINDAGDVTITGSEFDQNTGAGDGGAVGVSNVDSVTLTDDAFTGNTAVSGTGGGIYLGTGVGPVTIAGSTFDGNTAARGGGLGWEAVTDDSSVATSTFTGNTATGTLNSDGGGGMFVVFADAQLTVSDTLFDGNTASANGGGLGVRGISPTGGSLVVDDSTFTGNSAGFTGLSLWADDLEGPATISQSTFDETGDPAGAAILGFPNDIDDRASVTVQNSTLVGPSPFDIESDLGGALNVTHTIFATSGIQLPGAMTADTQWSLFTSAKAANDVLDVTGNQFSADPRLGALADNGGATPTLLPQPGSPAIDRGQPGNPGPAATDQRGSVRVVHNVIDIGAVEAPFVLAATGLVVPWGVVVGGVLLLLLGIVMLLVRQMRPVR